MHVLTRTWSPQSAYAYACAYALVKTSLKSWWDCPFNGRAHETSRQMLARALFCKMTALVRLALYLKLNMNFKILPFEISLE